MYPYKRLLISDIIAYLIIFIILAAGYDFINFMSWITPVGSIRICTILFLLYASLRFFGNVSFFYVVFISSIIYLGCVYNRPLDKDVDLLAVALIFAVPQAINFGFYLILGD